MAWAEKDLSSLKGGGGRRGDVVSGYFHPNHQQAHKVKRGGRGKEGKGREEKKPKLVSGRNCKVKVGRYE